jgi:carbon monoxide dehydrogenase subunit G
MENGLILKGLVQRSYTIAADPAVCYEYLSDMKNLLTQVPHVTKVQIGKTSGKARAFFTITVLGVTINSVLDMEPIRDPENLAIRVKNSDEPLGEIPRGHFTGTFNSLIKVEPVEGGKSRVTSKVGLSFDGSKLVERGMFSRRVIEESGRTLLQEYCEKLTDDYIINLLENFRKWQAAR